jgi:tetratricopeptide (TPR) repeat protein
LLRRALEIQERGFPNLWTALNNLAYLYFDQERYADAEPLFNRSLAISEKVHGPNHPEVATLMHNLAGLYLEQGRYADAELLLRRSLAIRQKKRLVSIIAMSRIR